LAGEDAAHRGFPVGRLFAEVGIPASRPEILLMVVLLVNGCLTTFAFALDGFVLKRIFEFFETQELVHE
jgi:hypothetical protein